MCFVLCKGWFILVQLCSFFFFNLMNPATLAEAVWQKQEHQQTEIFFFCRLPKNKYCSKGRPQASASCQVPARIVSAPLCCLLCSTRALCAPLLARQALHKQKKKRQKAAASVPRAAFLRARPARKQPTRYRRTVRRACAVVLGRFVLVAETRLWKGEGRKGYGKNKIALRDQVAVVHTQITSFISEEQFRLYSFYGPHAEAEVQTENYKQLESKWRRKWDTIEKRRLELGIQMID